ncbi:MAG: PTPA-CTERM sorting domain-containing protein [Alkalinema sp. RU_4_3]|nr:PTPA-CTERM sorting domain-containing protein [Alkalinema sp. RU_4_3]
MKRFIQVLMASMTMPLGLLIAAPVQAATFTEVTDAGELLNTAAIVGIVTEINGAVSESSDIDLFRLTIDQTGLTTFDATPADNGPQLNINMFLFNEQGNPLFSLEPVDTNEMKFDFATTAGTYFLGIGTDDLDALDALGQRIAGNDSGIDNPNGVLARWSVGNESFGAYKITIATIPTNAVPTPALLPALLGFGIKAIRRKKQAEKLETVPVTV